MRMRPDKDACRFTIEDGLRSVNRAQPTAWHVPGALCIYSERFDIQFLHYSITVPFLRFVHPALSLNVSDMSM